MKKLFGQITLVLSLLYFGNAFSQEVKYSLSNEKGQSLGQAVFNYKPTGYETSMNGKKFSVEITTDRITAKMEELTITIRINSKYYHDRVGFWRVNPFTTSSGDQGFVKVLYVGIQSNGRLYREEFWLNGKLFSESEVIVDLNNQIVWARMTDPEGTLYLERL